MRSAIVLSVCTLALGGCAFIDDFGEFEFDGTGMDAAVGVDAGRDGGPGVDGGPDDGGPADAGPLDAGPRDAGLCGTAVCPECSVCVDDKCVALMEGRACTGGTCHGGTCCTGCWDGMACQGGSARGACGVDGADCVACPCDTDGCNDDGECIPAVRVRSVTAGGSHTCAILETNALYCWGNGFSGQTGVGLSGLFGGRAVPQPVTMPAGLVWTAIAGAEDHTCGLTDADNLYCWGRNHVGQLGIGTMIEQTRPVAVTAPMVPFRRMDVGGFSSCAIDSTGLAQCWGTDMQDQLGNGAGRNDSSTPTTIVGTITAAEISVGRTHACLIDTDETLHCWGSQIDGQTGLGTIGASQPIPAEVGTSTWVAVSAGGRHTCALRSPGRELYCFGANDNGQLGLGVAATGPDQDSPMQVGTETGWRAIAAGDAHTCAIADSGELRCFGLGGSGRLGIGGTGTADDPTPVAFPGPWVAVAAGDAHTCGIDDLGRLRCWGANPWGQLGLGDVVDHLVPGRVCLPPDVD